MPTWGSREPYAAPTAGMTLPRDFSSPGGCDGGMASVILSAAPAAMRPIRSRAYILTPPVEQRRRQPTRRPGAAAHANPCPSTSPSRWTKTILNTIEPLNGTATTTPPKAHGGCPSYRASSAGSGPICRDRTASPRQRWRRSRKPGGHRRLGHPRPHPPADLPGESTADGADDHLGPAAAARSPRDGPRVGGSELGMPWDADLHLPEQGADALPWLSSRSVHRLLPNTALPDDGVPFRHARGRPPGVRLLGILQPRRHGQHSPARPDTSDTSSSLIFNVRRRMVHRT